MSRNPAAHRAEFSVRCACGIEYKSDDSHIGRKIKCRCGRTVVIARPKDEYVGTAEITPRRKRRHRSRSKLFSGRGRRLVESMVGALARVVAGVRNWFVVAWLEMASYRSARRWTARLSWAWSALVVVAWILLFTTSEWFLPATMLAYGPRFVLLAPFVLLIPLAAVVVRRALVPLTIALVIVLWPIMGGRISLRTIGKPLSLASPSLVRVMTFNAQGGGRVAWQIRDGLERMQPDVIAVQECGNAMWDSLQAIKELNSRRHYGLCTASRWPIESEDSMPRAAFEQLRKYGAGGSALVIRYVFRTPLGPLMLVNLHLETARKGLESLVGSDGFIPDGPNAAAEAEHQRELSARRLNLNAQIRERESASAARFALPTDLRMPVIVVGDFNLPVESTIFRKHWGDFTDAFDASGTGFGWTKREGSLLRIRIDHILVNASAPQPLGAWVGPDLGSDHLPVIADLAWRR